MMEIARRLVPLVLLLAAIAHVASAPDGTRPWLAWGLIAGAVAVYLLLPFEQPPEGALRHSRLAAVLLPDLIGFTLSLTFFGIYIVLVADNPNLWGSSSFWVRLVRFVWRSCWSQPGTPRSGW
ncbi:MAG: hypothetical protein M5U16_04695 [Hyphomicrobium sp.]|nr:hypothetical protein [Hyphomicrobium sp.]